MKPFIPASVAALLLPLLSPADPIAETGRKIAETHAESLVRVEAVVNISVEGSGMAAQEQEQKTSVLGTVVDASGLVLVSEGMLDPTKMMKPMTVNVGGSPQTITIKGELFEVRIKFPDGSEIPARVVMADEDLDLAFVAPDKALTPEQAAKFKPMALASKAALPRMLDQSYALTRLGENMNHEPAVSAFRIHAILSKPRTAYLGSGEIGAPVFNEQAQLLGFTMVRRNDSSAATPMGGGRMQMGAQASPVIVPLSDIAPVATQAVESARKGGKKDEAGKNDEKKEEKKGAKMD